MPWHALRTAGGGTSRQADTVPACFSNVQHVMMQPPPVRVQSSLFSTRSVDPSASVNGRPWQQGLIHFAKLSPHFMS